MRCYKIVTWIFILSIVNFALGAPAAVRGRLEMSVNVDVAEGGTATSQKRWDPLDDWSTSNAADRPPTPPTLNPSELDRLWEEVEHGINRNSPLTPESPGLSESVDSTWSNYEPSNEPSNPGSPTGSHPGPTGGSPLPPPHPGPSEDHFSSPPGPSANPDTLLSTDHQPKPPQRPLGGSPLPPLPHPGSPEGSLPSRPGIPVNADILSSTGHQPTPPQSPTGGSSLPVLPHPGPPDHRFPITPGWSVNPDTLSSTGHQLMPPPSPTGGSPLPLLHPGPSDRVPSTPGWSVNPDSVVNRSPADAATESNRRLSSASPRTVRGPFAEYTRFASEPRQVFG